MAEPQIVDYIKKARQAGQPDELSWALLYKNGWTKEEVNEALDEVSKAFSAQNQPQPVKPQIQAQLQQPVNQPQEQQKPQQPQSKTYYQPEQNSRPKRNVLHLIFNLSMVLVALIITGVAGYFIAGQFINLSWNFGNFTAPASNPASVVETSESIILKAWDNSPDIKSGISQQDEMLFKKITNILINKKAYNITRLPNGYSVLLEQQKVVDALPDIFFAVNQEYPGAYTLETFQNKINDLFVAEPISVNLSFDQTGEKINKIDTALNFEEFIQPFVKIQKIKTNMIQIGLAAQSIFNVDNSYEELCLNSLLNGKKEAYGKLLTVAANDIIKQGAKNPICYGNSENYCVSSQQADGSWLCIDKNGSLGKTKCVSSSTICQMAPATPPVAPAE